MWGVAATKSFSKQQKVVALSSGEAEFYAAVKVGSELLGMKSLARDFVVDVVLHLHPDAKATLGVLMRRGAGSMKHVDILVSANCFGKPRYVTQGAYRSTSGGYCH